MTYTYYLVICNRVCHIMSHIVFRLFWFSCQYLPSDWLETPLRKPNRGEGLVSAKPRLKNVYDFFGLLYCIFVSLWVCFVPWPYIICFILLQHDTSQPTQPCVCMQEAYWTPAPMSSNRRRTPICWRSTLLWTTSCGHISRRCTAASPLGLWPVQTCAPRLCHCWAG